MTDDPCQVISEKHWHLKDLDRTMRTAALQEISAKNAPLFRELHKECEEVTGHKFKFDHYNFNNTYKWYKCEYCGASKGEDYV